jgi:hypothetical protein
MTHESSLYLISAPPQLARESGGEKAEENV